MGGLCDSKSKLNDRGIKELLSPRNELATWLKVEQALARAQALDSKRRVRGYRKALFGRT